RFGQGTALVPVAVVHGHVDEHLRRGAYLGQRFFVRIAALQVFGGGHVEEGVFTLDDTGGFLKVVHEARIAIHRLFRGLVKVAFKSCATNSTKSFPDPNAQSAPVSSAAPSDANPPWSRPGDSCGIHDMRLPAPVFAMLRPLSCRNMRLKRGVCTRS